MITRKVAESKSKTKVSMKECYRDLIDGKDEDDEMDEWVMSLNVKDVTKQRSEKPRRHLPRTTVKQGLSGIDRHKEWYNHHVESGDTCLRYALATSGKKSEAMTREAVRYYNLADDHYPPGISLLINRCIAYESLGNLKQALADAERAVDMEAENPKAVYRVARMYRLSADEVVADMAYKKCCDLSGAMEVWYEMINSRLEYLMKTEECTADEVDDAHILADTLSEAVLFVQAMKDHAAREKDASANPDEMKRRQMQLSLSTTSDFIILDLEEQVMKFNSFLTPSNIFGARGVFLYDCSCRNESMIRNAFRKCGPITGILIKEDYVSIQFLEVKGPVTAISLMAGALGSGLTDPGKVLTVRFPPCNPNYNMDKMIMTCIKNGQCLGWRTTGCHLKKQCKFRHLEADFRVDLHPFMQQASSQFQKAAERQLIVYRKMNKQSNQENGFQDKRSARTVPR